MVKMIKFTLPNKVNINEEFVQVYLNAVQNILPENVSFNIVDA